jgi:hypothetical protein
LMTTQHRKRSALLVSAHLVGGELVLRAVGGGCAVQSLSAGPEPDHLVGAVRWPYSVSTSSVSSWVSGFGGGTIYYPTGTSETFGGIVASPGYTASSSSLAWYGRRLASHGFVVLVIDTNSRYDQPNSRATQLLAAADWLSSSSPPSAVRARLDSSRMAVSGHSMGGGGSLAASNSRSSLRASVPLTAWHTTKTWSSNRVPQLIVGAQNDSTASVSSHSIPFYNGPAQLDAEDVRRERGAGTSRPTAPTTTSPRWRCRGSSASSTTTPATTSSCAAPASPPPVSTTWSDVRDNCNPPAVAETGGTTPPDGCVHPVEQPDPREQRSGRVDLGHLLCPWLRGPSRSTSYFSFSSLQQTGPNEWAQVSSC